MSVSLPAALTAALPQLESIAKPIVEAVSGLVSAVTKLLGGALGKSGGVGAAAEGVANLAEKQAPEGAKQAVAGSLVSGGGAKAAPAAEAKEAPKEAPKNKGAEAAKKAHEYIGTPYVWGGTSTKGFDCSGLTQYVMKQMGIDIPRVAADQAKSGKAVDKKDLQPGDLLFFNGGSGGAISHTGIYIGDGKMIHAPQPGEKVKIADITSGYHAKTFVNARRYT